jgi:predicted alpha-1,6-mannanase (GH76 family)
VRFVCALSAFSGVRAADASDALALYGPVADSLQNSTQSAFFNGTFYRQSNGGKERYNYWWQAHGLDTLIDAYRRTRNTVYRDRMKTLLHGIRSGNQGTYINQYYDDMEWLGLASLRAFELTGDREYRDVAELLWSDIKGGLSRGMFSWNKRCAPECKNTIGSTPAIILGARLHALRSNPADLEMVRSVYAMVKEKVVDPATGSVGDGVKLSTGVVNKRAYSYNQGMFIGAGLELYQATRDTAYLDDALKTTNWVLDTQSPNGMIYARERGGGDGGLFKGILVRYLALLAREGDIPAATRDKITGAIKHDASVLNSIGIHRPEMIVGAAWSVPAGTTTDYSIQLSGVMLMETAAVIDLPIVYQNPNYRGRSAVLPPGKYRRAGLAARGAADNDISSLTVPAGWAVTLFDRDRFAGASLARTANDNHLASSGFDDRGSSIVVTAPASSDVVTLFSDCQFKGYAVALPVGSYTMTQLQEAGMVNHDISSLRVRSGFQVTAFENDMSGKSLVLTADDGCLVDRGFDDAISSVVVVAR